MNDNTKTVILAVNDGQGYSADQVRDTMTLYDLHRAIEEAMELYGEDARIVTNNGDRYGAAFGGIDSYRDTFTPAAPLCEICEEADADGEYDDTRVCEDCLREMTEEEEG